MSEFPGRRWLNRLETVACSSGLLVLLAAGACSAPGTVADEDAGQGTSEGAACDPPPGDGGPADAGDGDAGEGDGGGGDAGAGDAGASDAGAGDAGVADGGGSARGYLVGQNAWMDRNYGGQLYRLWPRVQESGVRLMRIGGNGYNTTPPSNAQYLEWIDAIRGIGAEPLVQVSSNITPAAAAALVRYVNFTMNRGVKFWSIGNEPDLASLSAATVAGYIKSHAPEMKAVDPSIQIFAPDSAWYNDALFAALLGGSADISGKDANGRYYVDVVSFHTYPKGASAYARADVVGAAAGLRSSVNALLGRIASANTAKGRTGTAALRWALTEFNVTYRNWGTNAIDGVGTHSFLNGQFFAEVFSIGMEKSAVSVMPWSVHESGGARTARDLGYLDNNTTFQPRSSFHHLRLVSSYFSGQWVPWTSNVPSVKVVTSRSGTQLAVMILNEHATNAYDYTLKLTTGAVSPGRPLELTVAAGVDVEYLDRIAAQSTVVLVFTPGGALATKVRYGLDEHARLCRPPEVEGLDAGVPPADAGCVP
ncbi:MAG: hypothetical protein ACYC8T_08940 [Myxococcaceae bacterium]